MGPELLTAIGTGLADILGRFVLLSWKCGVSWFNSIPLDEVCHVEKNPVPGQRGLFPG